jgi:hypothetical protein
VDNLRILSYQHYLGQGTLAEGEGSVQLTSTLRQIVLR